MIGRWRNRRARLALALALPALLLVGGWGPGEPASEPPEASLRYLVESHAHAIETNNRALALWYLHPGSPQRPELDTRLRGQLASYMERARTAGFEPLGGPDGVISARVDQEIVRVFGMKFTRATRRSIYEFRELDGAWRIWRIDEQVAR